MGQAMRWVTLAALLAAASGARGDVQPVAARDFPPESVISAGGLAVVVGARDTAPIDALVQSQRWVTLVLDTDRAAVTALLERWNAAGVTGVASAELRADLKNLPLRDGVVNLVVDTSGTAVDAAEAGRVLAPQGQHWAISAGHWRRVLLKDGPTGNWGHDYGGPDMNPLSKDTPAGLPSGLQWIAGWSDGPFGDPLVSDGVCVSLERPYSRFFDTPTYSPAPMARMLVRDAASGVALWGDDLPISISYREALLVGGGRVYWFPGAGKPMRSADARTGKNVRVYEQGVTWTLTTKKINNPDFAARVMLVDGNLVQAQGNRVVCLDASSGTVRWTWTTDQPFVNALVGGHDGQVYVGTGKNPYMIQRYYGSREAADLVALGLADGRERWHAPVPEGQLGQVIAQPGIVVIACSGHHCWNTDVGYIAVFEAKDGRLRWRKGWDEIGGPVVVSQGKPSKDPSGSNAVIFGQSILMSTSYGSYRMALADGARRGA